MNGSVLEVCWAPGYTTGDTARFAMYTLVFEMRDKFHAICCLSVGILWTVAMFECQNLREVPYCT